MMTISVLPVKTDLKAQELAVINEHQGWENAILSMDLAEAAGMPKTKASQRKLQIIIRELRRENKPILSQCTMPYGYYWPASWYEVQSFIASMKSRLVEDAYTLRDVKVGAGYLFAQAEKVRMI